MRRFLTTIGLLLICALLHACGPARGDDRSPWPSFRGAAARGVAEGHPTPVEWDPESGKNLRWKTAIPGMGHGSPVIWGNRIFVTTAVGAAEDELKVGLYGNIDPVQDDTVRRFKVYCLDRNTGEILWERTAHEGVPKVRRHLKASYANSTPATDGKHVVVFFGSQGLYCYDVDGKLLWKKDLGTLDAGYYRVPQAQWGFASSPMIHGDRVVVQCDIQKGSFIAALSLDDGEELWRKERNEVPTWSSPTVLEAGGRTQVITNGYRHIGGYDLATGKELWKMHGGGDIPVPTPIFGQGLIFITNAHGGAAPIYAIRPDARGDITLAEGADSGEFVAWSAPRSGSYMQTPLIYGEHLYVCRDNGVLTVFSARDGKRLGQLRLGGGSTGFTASAVAADGKLYYTSELGDVFVLRPGPKPELLATNEMGELCMSTPAISEGTLFFRTRGHVVAIGQETETP